MQELRPFQDNLIQRTCQAAMRGARVIALQGATGCGKNTIAAAFARRAFEKGKHVLAMAHRRRLVDQISDRFGQWEVPHGVLMRGEEGSLRYNVVVASRDTLLSRCMNNQWLGLPPADLVIVDEAHHAADPDSEYRRILEQYPKATILLLSATPVAPDGSGLGPWAQALVCAAPTSQLVKDGYLCPVRCYAPDRKMRGKKYVRGMAGDLVESWQQYAEGRPTVLFCTYVKHSLDAVESFQAQGIAAAHLDADTPDFERDRICDDLAAGKIKVISNVGIVGEGVDIPELGCCQIFCEMRSRVRFLQACGRIMRPHPGKEYGILIDHAGAVFRHGFPDEDTEWTLDGNADEDFKRKHAAGETEKAFYCKHCQITYHGSQCCPACGRQPVKPPRSIFAPLPAEASGEVLTEADRRSVVQAATEDEKVKHWLRCVGVAFRRGGSFGQACVIWKQKYPGEWPKEHWPCHPGRFGLKQKVHEVYPDFGKKKGFRKAE